jgi:HEAT repeat protein
MSPVCARRACQIAHPSSAPLFKTRISDKDPLIRRAAAEGLARIGDASEAPAIQTAATSESSEMVRAAMTFAMVKFGQNYMARLVDFFGSDRTALQVQEYLLEIGPSVLPELTPKLKEPVAGVRAGVVEIIGALGQSDSIPVLEPLTRDRIEASPKRPSSLSNESNASVAVVDPRRSGGPAGRSPWCPAGVVWRAPAKRSG